MFKEKLNSNVSSFILSDMELQVIRDLCLLQFYLFLWRNIHMCLYGTSLIQNHVKYAYG
jgi:hypothetical protein